ncbi:glycoside hydrolase family 19 protein [Lysobacter sp. CA199]|uniref:glycoside hydrolase family 19 protein n=1 Tax=Lysobacter sp. CA199 TaxID=3455608 RepID=UPI003F8D4ECE
MTYRKRPAASLLAIAVIAVITIATSFAVSAERYDSGRAYAGDTVVEFQGQRYRAKWYANVGQSPAQVATAAHSWDTPWELVDAAAGSPAPAPVSTPAAAGDTYVGANAYPGGCVVIHGDALYRAKWYANAGQSPADVATAPNPWDTPWELAPAGTSAGCPDGGGTPPGGGDPPGTEPGPDGEYRIARSALVAKEAQLTDSPLMRKVKESIRTLDNAAVEAVLPGRAANPDNVRRVESILSNAQFEFVFPMRAPEYSYRGLLQAVAKFPAVCATYANAAQSDAICRKTLATMVAHFAQETGGHDASIALPQWRQALVHVREMGWNENMRNGYNGECNPAIWQGKTWPCGKFADGTFKSYFGRGAKQLSYNYNYGPFSEAMYGDVRVLLDRPDLVADTWLNLASATFFFSYPQPPKPSMLHVIDGTWAPNAHDIQSGLVPGFGVTTQIINGGVECGGSAEHLQSQNRIAYYRDAAAYFQVPVPGDEVLGCKGMKQFDANGAGALAIYWERDESWVASNPGGKSYACKLVGYQTPHSAFNSGDYERCMVAGFANVVVTD